MLEIKDLSVELVDAPGHLLLENINIQLNEGQVTYILGPNGAGKSVLLHTIMGNPLYKVVKGAIFIYSNNKKLNILDLQPEERAHRGIFVSWQNPVEVPGLTVSKYLFAIYCAKIRQESDKDCQNQDIEFMFAEKIKKLLKEIGLNKEFLNRDLYTGFSGGEKKRLEVLSLLLLQPKYIFLDELDSGLDIVAEKKLFNLIKQYVDTSKAVLGVVTHTFRVVDYMTPDKVVVLQNGTVSSVGDASLLDSIKESLSFN